MTEEKVVPPAPNFEGHQPRECGEHRTVGSHRAWCYDCTEWCYPDDDMGCKGCMVPSLEKQVETLQAEKEVAIERGTKLINDWIKLGEEVERLRTDRDHWREARRISQECAEEFKARLDAVLALVTETDGRELGVVAKAKIRQAAGGE